MKFMNRPLPLPNIAWPRLGIVVLFILRPNVDAPISATIGRHRPLRERVDYGRCGPQWFRDARIADRLQGVPRLLKWGRSKPRDHV